MTSPASWHFAEGDPITAELSAVKLLGGGSAYEAYLAFDETTYAPVVVKVLRPDQVDDESSLRGLRREVDTLAIVNHPVVVRGLRHELEGRRPHVVLEHIEGPRLSTLIRRYGPLQAQQYLPLGPRPRLGTSLPERRRGRASRREAQQHHHGRTRAADRPLRGSQS